MSAPRPSPKARTCWPCRCRTSPHPGRWSKQRLRGVEVARGLGEVGAIDVGNEAEGHLALAVVSQCLVRHHRPRSDPPMPTLMTLRIRLPVWPCHRPPRTRLEKSAILSRTACTWGTTSSNDGLPFGGAQGHVQDGPLLGLVDLLPAKHGIDTGPQAGFLGQLQEEPHRRVGGAVLRVVEVDADGQATLCGAEPLYVATWSSLVALDLVLRFILAGVAWTGA